MVLLPAMLVDTGAIFAIVPAPLLRRLGIRARKREKFSLADGTTITRRIGNAEFGYGGHVGAATVIFGEPGDACLLGALALESLGFILDPARLVGATRETSAPQCATGVGMAIAAR
jgi:predicted aspartyl protease